MPGMRTLPLTLGLACVVCCTACGGRTGILDTTGATGAEGGTGGTGATEATGGSGATNAVGGSSATKATGGRSAGPMGGSGATNAVGGSGVTKATGGKSAGAMGGSGATNAVGGSGATKATGGKSAGPIGGSGATNATGGKSAGPMGGGGATNAGGGSSASGGTAGSGGTSSMPITTCNDSFPFLGTWEGNILDFYFEPQEALKLVLSADASGMITGKLTWGDGAPPPAPQGADIPYPPGYWEQQTDMMMPAAPEPWPGFAYTIVRGAACDTTFRFAVSTSELWQDWCALQTPIDSGSYGWGCTLLGGGGSSDGTSCTIYGQNGESQTYPLWKCEACGSFGFNGGVCTCDQNGCFANMTATETFDLTYSVSDGDEILSGPDPDSSCSDCTVRLVLQN